MRPTPLWSALALVVGMLVFPGSSLAQTPDGVTPAVEEACTKYQDEGARYGLCIAYCEAQDCEGSKLDPVSCVKLQEKFIEYSIKKEYTPAKKPVPISCQVEVCSKEDQALCGGREIDCLDPATRECNSVCTAHFLGFTDGKPICVREPDCKKCVGETPKP